ncbi:uncharacterized protein LOC100900148 [Galendromus occidentalis]|uniref:Uncharacterized protein LOC100900148 n=1 Tax=Galendromus occidentalis TaxID=34638 RepID=A0AAJ7P9G8_9ACAR|nr:uncharacterized protein LOC100900148 [Galendromus occidentalis]
MGRSKKLRSLGKGIRRRVRSAMFGGFAEALAYHTPPSTELHSSTLDLKSLQGTLFSANHAALKDVREDFILIAECNEQHGPTPLVIIPNTVMVHSEEISTLAISLLSVDYQHVASGSFPRADTQILLPEIRENLHVLVNYTVLLDAKARGFVRPLCVAYVSHNKHKLLKAIGKVRSALLDVCNLIKTQNLPHFIKGLKNGVTNSQLEGPALVKYETTVANSLKEAENAKLVSQEKSEMFEESLKALREKLGVEPVGAPSTGLCPLAHIAPLGFALAVKWMLELLCKMHKYVPSDEVKLPSVIYGACPSNEDCRNFEIYEGMFDILSDLSLKVTKKGDLEYTGGEVYCYMHLNTLYTLPSYVVPSAILFDAYKVINRLDTSTLHNIFYSLCVRRPLVLYPGEKAVNFARFLALFVPRRVEENVKLYVDEPSIGADCALAAFREGVDPNLYKKKCSVLCVETFDFLGTKYNGHLLSSLWRRIQMVREQPQMLTALIASFLCELELHSLSTRPLSTCDASILKNYDRLFQ